MSFVDVSKISNVTIYSADQLIEKIKQVTMLYDESIKPYESATVKLRTINQHVVYPAQEYVLSSQLVNIANFRFKLINDYNVDILNMHGYVVTEFSDDTVMTTLPPIIEASSLEDCYLICDGMHRMYLSRRYWFNPVVVEISGVSQPYYAYPNPDGWDNVSIVKTIDLDMIKKFHRFPYPDYKHYYRNFNSVFQNVGEPRGGGIHVK